jgi:hypothetical protein
MAHNDRREQGNKNMNMSRRQFLVASAVVAGGAAVGCGGLMFAQVRSTDPFALYVESTREVLAPRFGNALAESIHKEIWQEFQALLPELPYVGGEANLNSGNLLGSAYCLAEYRVLKARGQTTEEVGRIIYEGYEDASDVPAWLGRVAGRMQHSKKNQDRWRAQAARSQERRYPDDWVFDFVEGHGQAFDYGLDITECGICKFYHAQGADELTPYLCLMDGVVSKAFARGLVRYKTLAEGAAVCDFRYKTGRETFLYPLRHGWPPRFLNEET